MDEFLINRKFFKEDQKQLLEDTKALNVKIQFMVSKYISDDCIVPVMRMNLQNVAQTLGILSSSFIMGAEQLDSRESATNEPPNPSNLTDET